MKKSIRLFLTGSLQPMILNSFLKENADKLGIKGYSRTMDDGRVEIFLEGDVDSVNKMMPICKRGPKHSVIRKIEEKQESFQDFKNFKILNI